VQLTENFTCFVTKDEEHFAVHNTKTNAVDGGYGLSERAHFKDEGVNYSVTIFRKGEEKDSYSVDLKIEGEV